MKYFTMDELNDIANELLNNPSRETLKFLNDKYNKNVETNSFDNSNNVANDTSMDIESNQTTISVSEENNIPKVEVPIWQPADQLTNQNSIYTSSINNDAKEVMPNATQMSTPKETTLNVPTLDIQPNMSMAFNQTPTSNQNAQITNQSTNLVNPVGINNNLNTINQVPFDGNLWDRQDNKFNNMMQTTDNFNNNIEPELSNSVNNNFFSPLPEQANSSVPIYETTTQEGPTMFGQLEQNFNNNNAA